MPTIQGLKFRLDDEFRMRNRRHTDAERMHLRILIEGEGCKADALTVAQVGTEMMLCDGYSTLSICEELGIKPTAPRVLQFPDRQSVLEWIDRVQEGRRNLTAEEQAARTAARQKKVAEMRGENMSERAIAEELGVSKTTVHRDLEYSGGPPGPPDQEPIIIQGKDGKQYSSPPAAPKETLFCRECRTRGLKKGCLECKELRAKAGMGGGKGSPKPKKIGSAKFDWKEYDKHFGYVARAIPELKKAYGDCGEHTKCYELLKEFADWFKAWKKRVTAS